MIRHFPSMSAGLGGGGGWSTSPNHIRISQKILQTSVTIVIILCAAPFWHLHEESCLSARFSYFIFFYLFNCLSHHRILHEIVHKVYPFGERKDQRDLQEMCQKLVDACNVIAGSSLEQTTWLRRNMTVKFSPQENVDEGEDRKYWNTFLFCFMCVGVANDSVL